MLQLALGEGKRLQRRQPSSARRGKGVGSRAYLDLGVGRYKCPLLLSFHTYASMYTVLVRGTSSTSLAAEDLQRKAEDLGLFELHGSNGTSMSHDHMWRRRPL